MRPCLCFLACILRGLKSIHPLLAVPRGCFVINSSFIFPNLLYPFIFSITYPHYLVILPLHFDHSSQGRSLDVNKGELSKTFQFRGWGREEGELGEGAGTMPAPNTWNLRYKFILIFYVTHSISLETSKKLEKNIFSDKSTTDFCFEWKQILLMTLYIPGWFSLLRLPIFILHSAVVFWEVFLYLPPFT